MKQQFYQQIKIISRREGERDTILILMKSTVSLLWGLMLPNTKHSLSQLHLGMQYGKRHTHTHTHTHTADTTTAYSQFQQRIQVKKQISWQKPHLVVGKWSKPERERPERRTLLSSFSLVLIFQLVTGVCFCDIKVSMLQIAAWTVERMTADSQMSQISQTAEGVLGDCLDLVPFNESVQWVNKQDRQYEYMSHTLYQLRWMYICICC